MLTLTPTIQWYQSHTGGINQKKLLQTDCLLFKNKKKGEMQTTVFDPSKVLGVIQV